MLLDAVEVPVHRNGISVEVPFHYFTKTMVEERVGIQLIEPPVQTLTPAESEYQSVHIRKPEITVDNGDHLFPVFGELSLHFFEEIQYMVAHNPTVDTFEVLEEYPDSRTTPSSSRGSKSPPFMVSYKGVPFRTCRDRNLMKAGLI